ncbi:Lrp/AsnC family transcriptional regulator [Arenicella sp. 4NH20-0111]|uniref:Lrp/AsnC family transcriptional regulator n=1 Tax=Arenicella sp. 4NH20-0111 TaxID=3127648 RepID=UPI003108FFBC
MQVKVDRVDKRLLEHIQRDASLSASELGDMVGLSQAACWRRIQRLEESGVIKKRVALLDGTTINCGTIVLAHVKLSAHGRAHFDEFSQKIEALPNVLECFVVLGDQDFFIKVAVKDVYDYERFFFNRLSSIEGVAEIRSAVALSQIKNETALPLSNI